MADIRALIADDAYAMTFQSLGQYRSALLAALSAAPAAPQPAQPAQQGDASLSFAQFRQANVARCLKWHPQGLGSWSPSDWLTAALGELGELASEVKMFNRERDGLVGNKQDFTVDERKKRMAKEAADVVTYIDLFCAERDIDLGAAVVSKFNEVSERVGFPDRIVLAAAPAAPQPARCPQCNYQHGHQIGCENNPVDIALKAQGSKDRP